MSTPPSLEPQAVEARYARRGEIHRYHMSRPEVWHTVFERQQAMLRLLSRHGMQDFSDLTLVEVGCGAGGNLLEFLRWGWDPSHLSGIELLPERVLHARKVLPAQVRIIEGDACTAPVALGSVDIVFQSTVFSSLLDASYQHQLADRMWSWVKPGGAILWYDFCVDNPRNPDVAGVPMRRVRQLFPQAQADGLRVTLAPPVARGVCRLHPSLYRVFNALPWLRTHRLLWLSKPLGPATPSPP